MGRVLRGGAGRHLWRLLDPCGACALSAPFSRTTLSCMHAARDGQAKRRSDSLRDKRIAAQILDLVGLAFQQGPYNSDLFERCGLEINQVKMSSDLRVAYILWTSSPGMQRTLEKEMARHVHRLRSMVFSELSMAFSPKLVFIEDKPNRHAQELEKALADLSRSD